METKKKKQPVKLGFCIFFGIFFVVSLMGLISSANIKPNPTEDNTELKTATVQSVENLYGEGKVYIIHTTEYSNKLGVLANQLADKNALLDLHEGDTISFRQYETPNFTINVYGVVLNIAYLSANDAEIVTFDSYKATVKAHVKEVLTMTGIASGILGAITACFVVSIIVTNKRNASKGMFDTTDTQVEISTQL